MEVIGADWGADWGVPIGVTAVYVLLGHVARYWSRMLQGSYVVLLFTFCTNNESRGELTAGSMFINFA
jgi:hypothetical protein